ncbi:MAG TPA: LptA/OstA family protein [Vulgatibacter sp.]
MKAALLIAVLAGVPAPEAADAGAPQVEAVPAKAAATDEIDLTSETLTVEHRRHRATFGGGVVATRGDLEVRCPTLVATYDQRAKVREVVCEGPVSATQGAKTMTSSKGSFDNAAGRLHLEGDTTLTESGRRFSGDSLDFEVAKSQATLSKAEAELPGSGAADPLQPDDGTPFRITADRVVHDFATHRTIFDGHVVAVRRDLEMRASRLIAVGADDGTIERAWTEGGPVRVVQGDRRGVARRGTFVGGGQRLILEGDPVVTEGDSSLRGDRVTFHVGQGRVEISKPRAVFPLQKLQEGEGR